MDHPSWKKLLHKAAYVLLAFALLGGGIWLGRWSFEQIHHMRQLERVPPVTTNALVVGPANVSGTVVADQPLRAPDSGAECVYYRYKVEREDDDGWDVVEDDEAFAAGFGLRDSTGQVRVVPSQRVDFNVAKTHTRTSGDYRYTEWRIDPGDTIFVFGRAEVRPRGYEIHFTGEGSFEPIISHSGEAVERNRMALWSALAIFAALACLAYATVVLLGLVGLQSSSLYLFSVTGVLVASLLWQGLAMMHRDLGDADAHARSTLATTAQAIESTIAGSGGRWDGDWASLGGYDDGPLAGLGDTERERVRQLRIYAARTVRRTNANLARFPERLLGPAWGNEPLEPIALPPADQQAMAAVEAGHRPARLVPFWGVVGLVLGGLSMVLGTRWGLRRVRDKRTIENIPTSPISGVTYGVAEVKGTVELAEGTETLIAPMTSSPCVWYQYKIEDKDDSHNWETIHSEERHVGFTCRDATGAIDVAPADARVYATTETVRREGDTRYTERRICPGERMYAIGHAEVDRRTFDRLYMTGDVDDELPYIISTLSERDVQATEARAAFNRMNVGLLGAIFAALAGLGIAGTFGPTLYLAAAAIAAGFLFVALVLLHYNDLVFLRRWVDRNWANIDVALKKRFDLIERLEQVAHGYLTHEAELQEAITRARAASSRAGDDPTAGQAAFEAETDAAGALRAVVEDYPELRGDAVTGRLFEGLRDVEDEIALMRSGYNASVERYNTRLARVPEVFLAKLFRFAPARFFGQR